eukprot:g516.t1
MATTCEPCDDFRLDMKSQQFGMCVCGFPRNKHNTKKKGKGADKVWKKKTPKKKKKTTTQARKTAKSGTEDSDKKKSSCKTKEEGGGGGGEKEGSTSTRTNESSHAKVVTNTKKIKANETDTSSVMGSDGSAQAKIKAARKDDSPSTPKNEDGSDEPRNVPCDEARVDMTSSQFGMCKCGFPLSKHKKNKKGGGSAAKKRIKKLGKTVASSGTKKKKKKNAILTPATVEEEKNATATTTSTSAAKKSKTTASPSPAAAATANNEKTTVTTPSPPTTVASAATTETTIATKKNKTIDASLENAGECCPCSNFRLDMHSKQFGMCVCGFPKVQHAVDSSKKKKRIMKKKKSSALKKKTTATTTTTPSGNTRTASDETAASNEIQTDAAVVVKDETPATPLCETPRHRADSVHSVGVANERSESSSKASTHEPTEASKRGELGDDDGGASATARRLSFVPGHDDEGENDGVSRPPVGEGACRTRISSALSAEVATTSSLVVVQSEVASPASPDRPLSLRRSESLKHEIAKAIAKDDYDRVTKINLELMRRKKLRNRTKGSIKKEMADALAANDFESVQRLNRELLLRDVETSVATSSSKCSSDSVTKVVVAPPGRRLSETPRHRAHSVVIATDDDATTASRKEKEPLHRPASIRSITTIHEAAERRLSESNIVAAVSDERNDDGGVKPPSVEHVSTIRRTHDPRLTSEKTSPLLSLGPPFSRATRELKTTVEKKDSTRPSASEVGAPPCSNDGGGREDGRKDSASSSSSPSSSPFGEKSDEGAEKSPKTPTDRERRRSTGKRRKAKSRRIKSSRVNAAFLTKLSNMASPGGFRHSSEGSRSEGGLSPTSSPSTIDVMVAEADSTKLLGTRAVMKRGARRRRPRRRKLGFVKAANTSSEVVVSDAPMSKEKDVVSDAPVSKEKDVVSDAPVSKEKEDAETTVSVATAAVPAPTTSAEKEQKISSQSSSDVTEKSPAIAPRPAPKPQKKVATTTTMTTKEPKKAASATPSSKGPLGSNFKIPFTQRSRAQNLVRRAIPRKTRCVHCNAKHNSHSRECTECGISYCRTCKKVFMAKAAKKTWSCKQGFGCRKRPSVAVVSAVPKEEKPTSETTTTTTSSLSTNRTPADKVPVVATRPKRPIVMTMSGRETPKKVNIAKLRETDDAEAATALSSKAGVPDEGTDVETEKVIAPAGLRPSRPKATTTTGRETLKKIDIARIRQAEEEASAEIARETGETCDARKSTTAVPKPKPKPKPKPGAAAAAGTTTTGTCVSKTYGKPRTRLPTPSASGSVSSSESNKTNDDADVESPKPRDEEEATSKERTNDDGDGGSDVAFRVAARGEVAKLRQMIATRGLSALLALRNKGGHSLLELAKSRRKRDVVALLGGGEGTVDSEAPASASPGTPTTNVTSGVDSVVDTISDGVSKTSTTTTSKPKPKKKKKRKVNRLGKFSGKVGAGFLAKLSGLGAQGPRGGGFAWSAKSLREAKEKRRQEETGVDDSSNDSGAVASVVAEPREDACGAVEREGGDASPPKDTSSDDAPEDRATRPIKLV